MSGYNWDRTYHGVALVWEPKIVRVMTDEELTKGLRQGGRAYAYQLAEHAKKVYRDIYGTELGITTKSLACEIFWHHYIFVKATRYEKKHGEQRFTRWLIRHMDVIDCGEKSVDNNRFVWDILAVAFGSFK